MRLGSPRTDGLQTMSPPGNRGLRGYAAAAAIIGILAFVCLGVEEMRWRTNLVVMQAMGRIEGLAWDDLWSMMRPGSPYYLRALQSTPNAYAIIVNPYNTDADREHGERLFQVWCASCHGAEGTGGAVPSLVGRTLKAGDSDWSIFQTVKKGRAELGMPPVPVADEEAWQIVGHVRALRNGSTTLSQDEDNRLHRLRDFNLAAERIETAAMEPHNWLTYSGTYSSWRYSELADINRQNVADLKLGWSLQLGTNEEYVETSPIVVDGIMYLSAPDNDVLAVDAASGTVLWRYARSVPQNIPLCCGRVNRGVAVLGELVFIGTLDSYLVALDAKSGRLVWETQVADYTAGYTITAAPLAVRDKIIVGIAGGEYGIRGFLDAYDSTTGARAWRFYTVPEPGEPAGDTWSGDSWRTGGGPTWLTGSFDPTLGLLYWGVGNPAPDFNGDVRLGDNLYTDSVIALDMETGALRWHFQFTPHDEHDWDSNQIPVLVDREVEGMPRRLMLWANRNGFYYVLDRVTGEFLHASPFVTQNWAERIDSNGRPIKLPSADPSPMGTLTWPGLSGGANWWSPSYSPQTDLIYVPFAEAPKIFFKNIEFELDEYVPGLRFEGSASVHTGEPLQNGVRALDPDTGEMVWEFLRPQPRRNVGRIGGVLSTAGDVVFFGDLLDFVAYDARLGRELWRVNLGGHINASPTTFAVDGQQRVAIPAGNTIYVFRP